MTSFSENLSRARRRSDENFSKRFNPLEDSVKAIDELEEEMYSRDRNKKSDERQARLDEEARKKDIAASWDKEYARDRQQKQDEREAGKETEARADRDALARQRDAQAAKIESEAERKAKADAEGRAIEGIKGRFRGGADFDAVRKIAQENPALGEMDDDVIRGIKAQMDEIDRVAQAKESRQEREAESRIAENKAQAAKAARVPRGPAPPQEDDLDRRMKVAKVERMERLAKPPISPADVRQISGIDASIDSVDELAAAHPSVDTGRLASLRNSVAQFFHIDDEATTKFRADTANLVNEILHDLSGAAVTESEMKRLIQGLPRFEDSPAAYDAKLASTRAHVKRIRDKHLAALKSSGRDVSGFEGGTPAAGADAEASQADIDIADALFAD